MKATNQSGVIGTSTTTIAKSRVWETFDLNQLKSAPSQLLLVFPGFYRLQTCCLSFGPANIPFFFTSAG
jgi:hypothetical protein